MSRVVAYLRVSTDKQDQDNQRYDIERYAEQHDLKIDAWPGETISGTTAVHERKLQEVLDTLKPGDTLIVSEVSRLGRKVVPVMNLIESLVKDGITVIAVKQGYRFGDDINSKVIAFAFGLAAQIERDLISARTKEALAKRKAEGVKLGRPVGTGKPEHLKLNGKDEKILRLMAKRVSNAAIARVLDVNVKTLRSYQERQNLHQQLRYRLVDELGDNVIWTKKR